MSAGRPHPEVLFQRKPWFRDDVVLSLVARAGEIATVPSGNGNPDHTVDRIVDGTIYRLDVGSWKKLTLTLPELEGVANEFFRLVEGNYKEIDLIVRGGTYGDRHIVVDEQSFDDLREALAPFRRAPLAAAGAYR